MGCDICGQAGNTNSLVDKLASSSMQDICPKCERKANKMLERFRHMAWLRVRKKLKTMQKELRHG